MQYYLLTGFPRRDNLRKYAVLPMFQHTDTLERHTDTAGCNGRYEGFGFHAY